MQEKSTQIKTSFAFEKEQLPGNNFLIDSWRLENLINFSLDLLPVTKMRCHSLDTHLNSNSAYPEILATPIYPFLTPAPTPAIYPPDTGHILSGKEDKAMPGLWNMFCIAVSNDSDTLSDTEQEVKYNAAGE